MGPGAERDRGGSPSNGQQFGTDERDRIVRDLTGVLRRAWNDPDVAIDAVERFGSGHSGFTYRVDVAGAPSLVLRLSPPGARIAGPADVGRQARVMGALHRAGLPVPAVVAASSELAVDLRSFALLELVVGAPWEVVVEHVPAERLTREATGFLRQLARLPPSSTGLADEPATTIDDELARWSRLLERGPDAVHRVGARLQDLLAARSIGERPPGLVHGDYHFGNILFSTSGAVVGVVDWEIAEIGQPGLDFGSLAVTGLRRRYLPDPNPTGDVGMSLDRLAAELDLDEHEATWYLACSCFKYGAILGYNLGLHRSGRRPDPLYDQLERTIFGLLRDGALIMRRGLDAVAR